MPRKKKSEEKKETTTTYHKSKNGRFYKKTKLASGKCQCRFVSKTEGEAGMNGSSVKKMKKSKKVKEETPAP